MKKVFRIIDRISEIVVWAAVILTIAMAVMYCIDIFGRLLFSWQNKGTFEIAQFALCLIVFISYPYTQVKRGHIHASFVVGKLPDKVKCGFLAFALFWSAILCGIVTYALWTQGSFNLFNTSKLTQVLEIPYWPLYYACSVLMGLFTVTIIMDFIKSIMAIGGNKEYMENVLKILS